VFCGDDPWARKDQELTFFKFLLLKTDTELDADVLVESGDVFFFSAGMESFNSSSLTGLFAVGCMKVVNTDFSSIFTSRYNITLQARPDARSGS
jgi:hypothetical protein